MHIHTPQLVLLYTWGQINTSHKCPGVVYRLHESPHGTDGTQPRIRCVHTFQHHPWPPVASPCRSKHHTCQLQLRAREAAIYGQRGRGTAHGCSGSQCPFMAFRAREPDEPSLFLRAVFRGGVLRRSDRVPAKKSRLSAFEQARFEHLAPILRPTPIAYPK